jgi:hypothetical protein
MKSSLLLAALVGLNLLACKSASDPNITRFDCIGSVQSVVPTQAQVTISGSIVDFMGGAPVPGMRVTMCALSDPNCTAPFGTITTAADGAVAFSVPTGAAGFDGFAKFEKSGYVPQINFARPLVATARSYQATMISTSSWAMFLMAAGVTENALNGHIALRAIDCHGNTAAGVVFTLNRTDAGITARTVSELGIPSGRPTTDASGRGVFLNVPPGNVVATATLASTGQKIGTLNFVVQAGFVSGLNFPPTP